MIFYPNEKNRDSPDPLGDLAITIVLRGFEDAMDCAVGTRYFNEAWSFLKSQWCGDLLDIADSSVSQAAILEKIRKEKNIDKL